MKIDTGKCCDKCGCNAFAWRGDWRIIDIKSGEDIPDVQWADEYAQMYVQNGERKTGNFYLKYKGISDVYGNTLDHEDYPEPAKVRDVFDENGKFLFNGLTPSSAQPERA